MGYQVLARKLRPGSFEGLVGQEHVVRALTHALDNDRLHHAYLFTGTRGVGKTTIARILAKSLNCETGVTSKPCGSCSVCTEVNEGRFIDLIEVDAASRTRVDDTRDLLENAQYLPSRGRYKVYLIDEVHMLSASSFNALLKTLEEPPEHVKFLLATTDPKKVPVTVLSRCLQFQLKNISSQKIADYLESALTAEEIPFEVEALQVIGRTARGSMRDALSITDQAIAFGQGRLEQAAIVEMLGLVGRDEVGGVIDALAAGDARGLLKVVEELADRAVDFDTLLQELLEALHAMAVAHALGESESAAFPAETVQLFYQIALMGYRDLQIAPEPRSGVEMTLLRMLTFAPDEGGMKVPPLSPAGTDKTQATPKSSDSPASKTAPAPAPKPRAAVARTPRRAAEHDPWVDLVGRLQLGGVARMLAEHSVLAEQSEGYIRLLLDRAHDTLLNEAQVQSVRRALCEHLGREIQLEIEPADLDIETPARRRERIAAERQHDAEQVLRQDSAVQSLIEVFGGRLEDVQPVDSTRQGNPSK